MYYINFFLFPLLTLSLSQAQSSLEQTSASQRFVSELQELLKKEAWQEIVDLGEKALTEGADISLKMAIHDQLVSTYFRLGEYDKGLSHAERLATVAAGFGDPAARINSLYKLSAILRGAEFYSQGRKAIQESLALCQELSNDRLLARVIFNYAALEMEDPQGNLVLATNQLKQAEALFMKLGNEEDYLARTQIRLGKAYLLQKMGPEARSVVEEMRKASLEPRTHMHFLYLEAQVLFMEENLPLAEKKALEAKALALSLGAKADEKRYEEFLHQLH